MMSLTMILFWFSLYAYVPQMNSYAKEMGASYKLIGLITGAYGFSQTILRIPLGILSDRLRKRKIFIQFGLASAALSAMIVYIFPNPYVLLITRLLAGVASATWVNFTVLFLNYFSSNESAKAIGIATSNSKIGQLIAMFLGGIIAMNFGVKYIFLLSIVSGIIAYQLGFYIKEDRNDIKETKEESPGLMSVIKNKRVVLISVLGSLVQLIAYSTTFGFTPLIASKLGANDMQLSYLSVLYTLPQILFSVIAGTIFVKKLGERKTLLAGFILSTILCIATPFAPDLRYLYILQLLSGIGNAITFTLLMSMVIKNVDTSLRTTTMGFYQAVYGIGMIIGPVLLGFIGDMLGLTAGFIVTGLIGLISIVLVMMLKEEQLN